MPTVHYNFTVVLSTIGLTMASIKESTYLSNGNKWAKYRVKVFAQVPHNYNNKKSIHAVWVL